VYPSVLSVHDCTVVPLNEPQGVDPAHVGDGPQEMPPLLLLLAPLLLPLLLPHSADSLSWTHTGWPAE